MLIFFFPTSLVAREVANEGDGWPSVSPKMNLLIGFAVVLVLMVVALVSFCTYQR